MIDLRSDTVTKPTAAMRQAMFEAEVGDDVYGEDPTVNLLEEKAAALVGKEAALWVPTGSMGNTIAIKLHTEHGQEVICDSRAHVLDWELSMMAWFCGCLARPVATPDGILHWDQIAPSMKKVGPHAAPTGLVCIENTHNMAGGTMYTEAEVADLAARVHDFGLGIHMDGARVFNAAAALQVPVNRLVRDVDTVMFCLSKGLGAPAGSILAGPADLMAKGRLLRKRLGGGMRQVGILAAAGLVALGMGERLVEDHRNAKLLAEKLALLPGIGIDAESVRTNIVIFDIADTGLQPAVVLAALKERGVLAGSIGGTKLRMVTHYDVSEAECLIAAEALADAMRGLSLVAH